MNLDMTIFHQTFFEETSDLLADLEGHLLRLEETPDDPELLNSIFRCAHSIKGGSATFGFTEIAHFTHSLETLLDLLRNGQAHVDRAVSQMLLESLDQLKALLAVARGDADSAPDSAPLRFLIEEAIAHTGYVEEEWDEDALRAEIRRMQASQNAGAGAEKPASLPQKPSGARRYHLRFVPASDVMAQGADPAILMLKFQEAGEVTHIQCDLSRLPALETMDPECCYVAWDVELRSDWDRERLLDLFEFVMGASEVTLTPLETVAAATETVPAATRPEPALHPAPMAPSVLLPDSSPDATPAEKAELETAASLSTSRQAASGAASSAAASNKAEAHTLRVSTDKVDKLINLVGELVINQSMLNEVIQDFSMAKLPRLLEAVSELERASRELQERVMAVRMLPIKHAFGRFPRLVRDLAALCGKRIELKTTGEETELDKSVIEAIADPLTHLIRNSLDHGLELPEERRAAGKSETGVIALNAFHEGGNIVIEVSDDGRGLDRERIYRKAVDRGLLAETDPIPSDETLYQFIFHPGFSTAKEVTDLSGRGVGMDIVKQTVQGLGGSIHLNSTPGKGARFRVRLPLTMAILEGLSLRVGGEVYILPLTSIVESIRPRSGDVRKIAGQAEVALVRGEVLPILRLYQVFEVDPEVTDPTQALLVIVENDGRKVALLVDELIGQSQVVIKSLETNYRKVDGIAGATILGDGRVALIVDVPGLIRSAQVGAFGLAA